MVQLIYYVDVTNTGIQHDVNIGVSLLNPTTGEELYPLPWFVIWNVPSGGRWKVTLTITGMDIVPGTYLAKCRAWTDYTPGTEAGYLDSVGVIYHGGTGLLHPPILDEATQTLVISPIEEVTAEINEFTVSV